MTHWMQRNINALHRGEHQEKYACLLSADYMNVSTLGNKGKKAVPSTPRWVFPLLAGGDQGEQGG